EARAFTDDNSVIVGTSLLLPPNEPAGPVFETAFVHTQAEGSVRLPDLSGGDEASGARAISADGTFIAGYGTDESGQRAVVWIDRDPKRLEDLFVEAGGSVPEGWALIEV